MTRIRVMQVIDSLHAGGAERVAVNMANALPREHYVPYLCVTRRASMALAELVAPDVGLLRLERSKRFDWAAVARLVQFNQAQQIDLLHAHGSSIFIAALSTLFPPHPRLVWHDHFGRYAVEERPRWVYAPVVRHARAVIAVNQPLAEWSRRRLGVPAERVSYIPNFVAEPQPAAQLPDVPGEAGQRIVIVANLRKEKDHATLLRAMAQVVRLVPTAHLLVVGPAADEAHLAMLRGIIAEHHLEGHVSLLGQRMDAAAILQASDVGVLSSVSEGLPLALIEYGMAGLAPVATEVGQCAEVLDGGRVGLLVPPREPERLARALAVLLRSPELRAFYGQQFRQHVRAHYSAQRIIERVGQVYQGALAGA
jgi:glycosyltransferase involved in cell wall biosynthesis